MVCLAALADAVIAAPPKLGATRLVCVDGPAGAGKTTLAARLTRSLEVRLHQPVPVVHMDDLYEGWSQALAGAARRLDQQVLAPLREGHPGRYQRYDWPTGRFAEWHEVPAAPVLMVEGVGSAPRRVSGETSLLIWVDAPATVRLRRGIERDGEQLRERWLRWMADERGYLAGQGTADRADIIVDGDPSTAYDPERQVVLRRGWPVSLPD